MCYACDIIEFDWRAPELSNAALLIREIGPWILDLDLPAEWSLVYIMRFSSSICIENLDSDLSSPDMYVDVSSSLAQVPKCTTCWCSFILTIDTLKTGEFATVTIPISIESKGNVVVVKDDSKSNECD